MTETTLISFGSSTTLRIGYLGTTWYCPPWILTTKITPENGWQRKTFRPSFLGGELDLGALGQPFNSSKGPWGLLQGLVCLRWAPFRVPIGRPTIPSTDSIVGIYIITFTYTSIYIYTQFIERKYMYNVYAMLYTFVVGMDYTVVFLGEKTRRFFWLCVWEAMLFDLKDMWVETCFCI